MVYVVTMKPNIITHTSIKSINTKETFTSTAFPTNKKSKFHFTLNTIYNFFLTTTPKNNKYNSNTAALIKHIKQATTKKMNKMFKNKQKKFKKNSNHIHINLLLSIGNFNLRPRSNTIHQQLLSCNSYSGNSSLAFSSFIFNDCSSNSCPWVLNTQAHNIPTSYKRSSTSPSHSSTSSSQLQLDQYILSPDYNIATLPGIHKVIELDRQKQQTSTQFNNNYQYNSPIQSSDDNRYVNTDPHKPSPAILRFNT